MEKANSEVAEAEAPNSNETIDFHRWSYPADHPNGRLTSLYLVQHSQKFDKQRIIRNDVYQPAHPRHFSLERKTMLLQSRSVAILSSRNSP